MTVFYCSNCGCVFDNDTFDYSKSEFKDDGGCPICGADEVNEVSLISDLYELCNLSDEEFIHALWEILNKNNKKVEVTYLGWLDTKHEKEFTLEGRLIKDTAKEIKVKSITGEVVTINKKKIKKIREF